MRMITYECAKKITISFRTILEIFEKLTKDVFAITGQIDSLEKQRINVQFIYLLYFHAPSIDNYFTLIKLIGK